MHSICSVVALCAIVQRRRTVATDVVNCSHVERVTRATLRRWSQAWCRDWVYGRRCFVDRQPVMHMMPIVRRGVGRINAERLDGIDQLQHALYLWPARQAQQAFAARPDIRDSRAALASCDRPQDVDA